MLDVRFRGDASETAALFFKLAQLGAEVAPSTVKRRAEGFTDQYGSVRVPPEWIAEWQAAGTPEAHQPAPGPVWADATIDRPALPAGDRRPVRRRPR